MPPDVAASLGARREHEPRQLIGFDFMGVFLRGVPHRIVPPEHWEAVEEDPGHRAAYLTCQCGASHRVELGQYPQSCVCARWFFFDGTSVWALLTPVA